MLNLIRPLRAFVALITSLCFLTLALAANNASAATHERNFCWGKTITPSEPCLGLTEGIATPYMSGIYASGDHSICVTSFLNQKVKKCSGGPGQGVYLDLTPASPYTNYPIIYTNSQSSTTVYGVVYWQDPPVEEPGPAQWYQGSISVGGGGTTAEPAISSWGVGRLDLFERGSDNHIYHQAWSGTKWLGWENLGGNVVSGPSAVSWSGGRIDLVAEEAGGSVRHQWFQNGWGGPDFLGSTSATPAISSWGENRLDVFQKDASGTLYHRCWCGSQGWLGWEKVAEGLGSSPDAVSWGGGRIDVVAEMADHSLGLWSYQDGSGWSYKNLGGYITAKPAIASQGPGKLDIFARGVDNGLYHIWTTNYAASWSNWEPMTGGPLESGPDAVSWGLGRVDVVAAAEIAKAPGQIKYWEYR